MTPEAINATQDLLVATNVAKLILFAFFILGVVWSFVVFRFLRFASSQAKTSSALLEFMSDSQNSSDKREERAEERENKAQNTISSLTMGINAIEGLLMKITSSNNVTDSRLEAIIESQASLAPRSGLTTLADEFKKTFHTLREDNTEVFSFLQNHIEANDALLAGFVPRVAKLETTTENLARELMANIHKLQREMETYNSTDKARSELTERLTQIVANISTVVGEGCSEPLNGALASGRLNYPISKEKKQ